LLSTDRSFNVPRIISSVNKMPKGSDLSIFKSYDVRGLYPSQLDEATAYEIGRVFPRLLDAHTIAIGRDMRLSGNSLFDALARGATESGADVIDIGMVSTDALYFAVGKYGYDGGIMITASHNPAEYNGMKFTRARAQAMSFDTGLSQIRDQICSGELPHKSESIGKIQKKNILEEFASHCLTFIDPKQIKPLKIAIDAGNGMGGVIVPYVFKHLSCEILPMYFEPDGSFPNHPANPLEPANMSDLQQAVLENKCDLGVAFDGDADRMFIVDEKANLVGGDIVTALVAINTLRHSPSVPILYNVICSRSVREAVEKHGGKAYRSPVGHSLIKKMMRDQDIKFGGEHSGHFYFKDNWYADSGMIALLQCLEVFSQSDGSVSETIAPIDRRFRSGEINSQIQDIPNKLKEIEATYIDAEIDYLDGLTVSYSDWWMNIRASNTEPFLRLNLEADSLSVMEQQREQILALIRS
jgi:phosphomannomutase